MFCIQGGEGSAKVRKIIEKVSFQVEPGKVQRTEVEYVFQLICRWVEVTTCYKIAYCALFTRVCDNLYEGKEMVAVEEVVSAASEI